MINKYKNNNNIHATRYQCVSFYCIVLFVIPFIRIFSHISFFYLLQLSNGTQLSNKPANKGHKYVHICIYIAYIYSI